MSVKQFIEVLILALPLQQASIPAIVTPYDSYQLERPNYQVQLHLRTRRRLQLAT